MLRFSKVIALNSDLETSQAFVFSRNTALEDTPSLTADLYLSAVITGAGENVFVKVRGAVADLNDDFFESTEPIPKRLDDGLSSIREKLADLEELEILLAAWRIPSEQSPENTSANVLFIENMGNQKILLMRDGEVIDLLQTGGEGPLISGYLKSGDRMLFLNRALFQFFTRENLGDSQIKKIFNEPVEDLEEEVNDAVRVVPSSPPLSAILVHYQNPLLANPEPVPLPNPGVKSRLHEFPVFKTRPNLPKLRVPKDPKVKRIAIAVAVAVVIILVLIVVHKKSNAKTDAQFAADLSSARSNFSQAQNLKDSNPDGAKQALGEANQQLAAALKIKPNDSDAKNLRSQIDQDSNSILKINTVTNWPLFLDLNLIKNGFSTDRMTLSQGELLLMDNNQKSLVEISLSQKTQNILAGGDKLGSPAFSSIYGEFAFVYSADKGVTRVDTNTLKTITASKPDSDWGEIKDVSGFGGNFYLLDAIKNQIWKYTPTDSGYSSKSPYFQSGTSVDFSDAERMRIDGSVWVLHSNDTIDRFTQGSPDAFSPSGLDKPLKNITAFFVSDETDNVYVIDADNSRLVVMQKNGKYVSQLSGDKFKDASDLVVDESAKKAYILENNKIYQIPLP